MANRRAYKLTSTTTLTEQVGIDVFIYTNHVSVINQTDGDVELYFGQTDSPDIILPKNYNLAFDNFQVQGKIYLRNSTGTGGSVYLHLWKKENY